MPILRAIKRSIRPTTQVEFAFEGEMGATVGHYPDEYKRLFYSMGKKVSNRPNIKFGISLNFNQVFGENFQPTKITDLQNLLDEVDFVGFSNYSQVSYPVTANNFATSVDSWLGEITSAGVTIPEGKSIHFTEVGICGGTGDEKTPALLSCSM